ncbi:MAG: sulfurtransferase TusA family protein [Deltaproteobacteria bacterium]|nr:MAG: sulfurtransferase TusA family protein [Deltaproteobacteria bacterium]
MNPPDETLDLTGVPCPQNAARTLMLLARMDSGEVLELIIDDGEPISLVPESIEDEGHEILSQEQLPDGRWRLRVQVD